MVHLPTRLNRFRHEAHQTIEHGMVKEIEFSGSTYQILIEDLHTHKECWVFMQLDGKKIKDAFCSCEEIGETDENPPCVHLAAAYLSIYNHKPLPLHQRFKRSLWNAIGHLCVDQFGDEATVLASNQAGFYEFKTKSKKTLFYIKAKNPSVSEQVDSIIKEPPQQTEETSLKFSNLPAEEIEQWRQGKPSSQLRYNLSFWSDLAKWLLTLQEQGQPYTIKFGYSTKQIPDWIEVHFDDVELGLHIAEKELPVIIPSLATVKSPLTVEYVGNQGIAGMTYDEGNGVLTIQAEKMTSKQGVKHFDHSEGKIIPLEGWNYVTGKGFFADEPHILLQTPQLSGEELAHAFNEHGRTIANFLSPIAVHFDPVAIHYKLFFDKGWNLHISAYVLEEGDLSLKNSHLFADWAYIEGKGFYHLEAKRFEQVETIIPVVEISDFISQNQSWLNTQEGFQTHVKSLEYQLTYTLNDNDRLTFSRTLSKTKNLSKLQDLGTWVYLDGHGFYPKTLSSMGFLLRPGLSLSAEQIPLFIRMHRDELNLIDGFFNSVCPVVKTGLRIQLNKQTIQIDPEYELASEFQNQKVRLFDYVTYVKDKGFYELPLPLRLPERFNHSVTLEGEDVITFLTSEIQGIQKQIISIDPRLELPLEKTLVTNFIAPLKDKGKGWYQFALFYETERGLISVVDLWEALKKKQVFGFFEAGLIDLREKRYDWLRQLKKDRFDKASKTIALTTLEMMRLHAFDPIELLETASPQSGQTREILDELIHLRTPDEPHIEGLLSHLRPYQEIGVRWLWFLYQQHLSGLLCDDMGLGKTHQAMGLIASIHHFFQTHAEGIPVHFLIVCPTSVIYHWQEKLRDFLPQIRVQTFYGSNRTLAGFKEDYDVLLTSYGVLRNEKEMLSKIPFELIVLDEIQISKNPSSRIYAALKLMKANMKVGLSGTPIENYLRELKSLFDIVLPSYMPSESEYREFFIRPVEKEQNTQRKRLLSRLIHPFILRRKKEDVLTDLPEKIEELAYCDLLHYQHQLYAEVLETRRRHILTELQDENQPISYMHIFALLSSLKQICDHPAVYLKKPGDYRQYTSGKWELFLELLREARESKQKVVVFSQYLSMLDIIESYLMEHGIGFASIRGATQDRKEQIHRFNHDPDCEVFVGSLQAAGLGIDLTAGSVVIHYDRWWNAARENQATDRVHRIGQTRGVQVFKLITKNTFEEKIHAMIQRKGQLMEDVIGVDEQNVLKKFSRAELMDLLTLVDTEEHAELSDEE